MRPEVTRRLVAGYAAVLVVTALLTLPGRASETAAPVAVPRENPVPAPASTPPAEQTPASTPAAPTAQPSGTPRTARTPAPSATSAPASNGPATAPTGSATSAGTGQAPRSTTSGPSRGSWPSSAGTPSDTPTYDRDRTPAPPSRPSFVDAPDLDRVCNGSSGTFAMHWSASQGARGYLLNAGGLGSYRGSGQSARLSCPQQARAYTISLYAYDDHGQQSEYTTINLTYNPPMDEATSEPDARRSPTQR